MVSGCVILTPFILKPLHNDCSHIEDVHLLFLSISMLESVNCCDFCSLLITFANSLDPDQDRQNVGRDLDPNRLTL